MGVAMAAPADCPAVVVAGEPFVVVAQPRAAPAVVVAPGTQGPPGRNGVDGATLSPDADNQIENRPNGLFVPPLTWQTNDW